MKRIDANSRTIRELLDGLTGLIRVLFIVPHLESA